MKKLVLSVVACFAVVICYAGNSVLDFTYAEGELSPYGKGKKETLDVAMCIDNPSFAGRKLTGIRAYINTAENISETSLWLTDELSIENNKNVPSIGDYLVSPEFVSLGEYNLQMLSVKLEEPYVLNDDPIYLGYTLTVDSNLTPEDKNPLILSEGVNINGFYLHTSASVLKWTEYSERTGKVAYIVAEIEDDYAEYSLGFKGYDVIYANENEEYNVVFSMLNSGEMPIENLKYTYSVDSGTIEEGFLKLDLPIEPSLSLTSDVTLSFNSISSYGSHDLKVVVTEVNGQENQSLDKSINCVVNVIPFVPVHRPLVEEYTGLWCQWCPKGYLAMEMIAEQYPDSQVSIAYHNGDPMEVTKDFPDYITGLPASSIDRCGKIDPYYGNYNDIQFGISMDLQNSMAEFTIASIDVNAEIEGNYVDINSSVRFVQDIKNAGYEIGYVLICNGLSNPTWVQSNAFSGAYGYGGTPLEVLTTWPKNVVGLVFNDVAVDASAMNGVKGSLPSVIKTNEEYTHHYTFNIDGNDLVQNIGNLVVAAFVLDSSNGRVINANKFSFSENSIKEMGIDKVLLDKEYYDLTGRKVSVPGNGLFILREKYSDGSEETHKIMKRE